MAMTFANLKAFLQTKLSDTTGDTETLIGQMINAAYKSILGRTPCFWMEKTAGVAVTPNTSSIPLAADCIKVILVERPVAFTTSPPITLVTQEDWETFRRPVTAVDEPLIAYCGGYTGSTTKQMLMGVYPACATTYTGTYNYRYYCLPPDMSVATDVPVFDDRWTDLLLTESQVQALRYEGRYEEASVLKQQVQQDLAALLQREDSGAEKK